MSNQELVGPRFVDGAPDFDLVGYGKDFGYLNRAYVAGVKPLIDLFFVAHPKSFERKELISVIAGWHLVACRHIPDEWREDFESLHWKTVKFDAVVEILNGGACRYDRACQAAMTVELAFHHSAIPALREFNARPFIQIRPSLYRFDRDTGGWIGNGKDEHHDKLVKALTQGRAVSATKVRSFLKEAGRGCTMTYRNAVVIQEHARLAGKTAHVTPIGMRTEATNCEGEGCLLGIADELADAFRVEREKVIAATAA